MCSHDPLGKRHPEPVLGRPMPQQILLRPARLRPLYRGRLTVIDRDFEITRDSGFRRDKLDQKLAALRLHEDQFRNQIDQHALQSFGINGCPGRSRGRDRPDFVGRTSRSGKPRHSSDELTDIHDLLFEFKVLRFPIQHVVQTLQNRRKAIQRPSYRFNRP